MDIAVAVRSSVLDGPSKSVVVVLGIDLVDAILNVLEWDGTRTRSPASMKSWLMLSPMHHILTLSL